MQVSRPTQAFAFFCFVIAIYLSIGGYLQLRWGLSALAFNEIVFLLLPSLAFVSLSGLKVRRTLPLALPSLKDALIVLVATAAVIIPMEILVEYQEKIWPVPQAVETFYQKLILRKSYAESIFKFFILALIPAVCEETFFRGVLHSLFRESFGRVGTVVLTAVLFGVAHANPWYFPYYLVLGLFLSGVREWRNNLALCMLAHFGNNLYSIYGQ